MCILEVEIVSLLLMRCRPLLYRFPPFFVRIIRSGVAYRNAVDKKVSR
jgi:hypothetical protein